MTLTRRKILAGVGVLLVLVVIVLQNAGGAGGFGLIKVDASSSYLGVALLVFLDAVCPVFPGETTLNAASTLSSQGMLGADVSARPRTSMVVVHQPVFIRIG